MRKNILALILCLLLTCGFASAASTDTFTDTAGHWAEEAIAAVVDTGLFTGTSETIFGPEQVMTRAMYVTVLGRLFEAEGGLVVGGESFSDVAPDSYCGPYIAWAAEAGLVDGYGGGRFGPDDPISREQMMTILYRYARLTGTEEGEISHKALDQYADRDDISPWAADAMAWGRELGYIVGPTGATLAPGGLSTRAQAATVLVRYMDTGLRHVWYDKIPDSRDGILTERVSTGQRGEVYLYVSIDSSSGAACTLTVQYDDTALLAGSGRVKAGETGEFMIRLQGGPNTTATLSLTSADGSPFAGRVRIVSAATEALAK